MSSGKRKMSGASRDGPDSTLVKRGSTFALSMTWINQILSQSIRIVSEHLLPEKIQKWASLDPNFKVHFTRVQEFASPDCRRLDGQGKRSFILTTLFSFLTAVYFH